MNKILIKNLVDGFNFAITDKEKERLLKEYIELIRKEYTRHNEVPTEREEYYWALRIAFVSGWAESGDISFRLDDVQEPREIEIILRNWYGS